MQGRGWPAAQSQKEMKHEGKLSRARTYLSLDVVHEPLHARLHAVRVLAWQQLRVPVAVQADAARQQLVELLHGGLAPHRLWRRLQCNPNSLLMGKSKFATFDCHTF